MSCLSKVVNGWIISTILMLTACLPPNKAPPVDQYPPPLAQNAFDRNDTNAYHVNKNTRPTFPTEDNQIDTNQSYDLPALVDLALRTHPETKISWEEAKAAAAKLERNRSAWYPTLTAMAFGQSFRTSFPIPGGPLVSQGFSALASLDLAWTLIDFGRRDALVRAGVERLSAANFAFGRKHQEIAYQVTNSYFIYQSALAKVTAGQQTLESAKSNSASVRAKLDQGLATKPDLLLAIQEQAKASYDLQESRGSVMQARVELMSNLGVSPAYNLQLTDMSKLPLPAELVTSVEKIIDQALDQRPDLMARLAELRAREAEVKKARADYWPKISLRGMIGNQYWGNVHTNPSGNQSYSANNMVDTAMLNVEWTLFDGFERSNAVLEAEAKTKGAKAQIEALRLEIMRDIWKAYADIKTQLEKREFALALLQAAEESYAASQESYTHGFSTVIELLSAQKDLARARYTEIDSRATLLRSAATLVYVSGGQSRNDLMTDGEPLDDGLPLLNFNAN